MTFIPTHVQIETVNRFCDARCPMCTIKFVPDWTKTAEDEFSHTGESRPAEVMKLETFKAIASKFEPYVDRIRFLSLHGCGEPMLDKGLPDKVRFAKEIGFKGVGFTSNCNALSESMAKRLLEAGLNCIIPSIDGLTKEVHETIRPRTNFERTVENVRRFIQLRDAGDHDCKVLVRMVRQQLNYHQWDDYTAFWKSHMSATKGDDVIAMDIHNTGGKVPDYDDKKVSDYGDKCDDFVNHYRRSCDDGKFDELFQPDPATGWIHVKASEVEDLGGCPDLFTRLSIFTSGDVALCSADQAGYLPLGNVLQTDPIEIFNGEGFRAYREKWVSKRFHDLKHCKDCTIVTSRFHKTYVS